MLCKQAGIAVMGHVDHGILTLIDALRTADVAAKESGAITQRVSSAQHALYARNTATLLNTPGLETCFGMRKNAAIVADAIVLGVRDDRQHGVGHAADELLVVDGGRTVLADGLHLRFSD